MALIANSNTYPTHAMMLLWLAWYEDIHGGGIPPMGAHITFEGTEIVINLSVPGPQFSETTISDAFNLVVNRLTDFATELPLDTMGDELLAANFGPQAWIDYLLSIHAVDKALATYTSGKEENELPSHFYIRTNDGVLRSSMADLITALGTLPALASQIVYAGVIEADA